MVNNAIKTKWKVSIIFVFCFSVVLEVHRITRWGVPNNMALSWKELHSIETEQHFQKHPRMFAINKNTLKIVIIKIETSYDYLIYSLHIHKFTYLFFAWWTVLVYLMKRLFPEKTFEKAVETPIDFCLIVMDAGALLCHQYWDNCSPYILHFAFQFCRKDIENSS